jgi:hypothetical protein
MADGRHYRNPPKIKGLNPHGLTDAEMAEWLRLRQLAKSDLKLAKAEATNWLHTANGASRVLRAAVVRTIRGMHSYE